MPVEEQRYEAAIAAAIEILQELVSRPDLGGPVSLSIVTYTILQAMWRLPECTCNRCLEAWQPGAQRPE